jgi:hypothetical protein
VGEFPQHFISGRIPHGVIDFFEMIDVRQNYSNRVFFAAGSEQLAVQERKYLATIPQPGKGIMRRCIVQTLTSLDELSVNVQNALSRQQAHLQFAGIKGLPEKVVSACSHAFEQVAFVVVSGKQYRVGIPVSKIPGTNAAAQFQTIHFRQNPIEQGKPRCLRSRKDLPRIGAVSRHYCFETPLLQVARQKLLVERGIFSNQSFHTFVRLFNSSSFVASVESVSSFSPPGLKIGVCCIVSLLEPMSGL